MDFESINNFLTLSDTLNYSKAAEDLHITQPTLTKCIHRLETELNHKLFFRNNRGVSLTSEGKIVKKHFNQMIAQNAQLVNELAFPEEAQICHLRVGFLSHSMQLYFPGFLRTYKAEHPNVIIHLVEGDQSQLIDSYNAGHLDIYIGTEGAREPLSHCNVIEVNQEPLFLLVPTKSKYASHNPISLEEVKDEPFILHGNTVSYLTPQYSKNNLTMRLCAEHQIIPKTIPCRYFHNIPLLVACNTGVALLTSAARFYGRHCVTFLPIRGHENDTLKINAYYDSFKKNIAEDFAVSLKKYIQQKTIGEQL